MTTALLTTYTALKASIISNYKIYQINRKNFKYSYILTSIYLVITANKCLYRYMYNEKSAYL